VIRQGHVTDPRNLARTSDFTGINPAIERLNYRTCNELGFIPRLPILLAVVLTLSTGPLANETQLPISSGFCERVQFPKDSLAHLR